MGVCMNSMEEPINKEQHKINLMKLAAIKKMKVGYRELIYRNFILISLEEYI